MDNIDDEQLNPEETSITQENVAQYDNKKTSKKGKYGIFGALLVILAKFKSLLILLKLGKFATTLISMFLMIVVYAKLYGWAFGVGFVLLLFVHEMGHYIVSKHEKLNVSLPLFIPFVGALINLKETPKSAEVEAKVGLGGPVLGSIASAICMLLYYSTHQDIFLALAYIGFMLNLFNLIPIHPMDGGRAVTAISPWLWGLGIPIGVVFIFKFHNPILILLLIMGIIQLVDQIKNPKKEYYSVKPSKRILFAVVYFGLLLLLGIGMVYIHDKGIQIL